MSESNKGVLTDWNATSEAIREAMGRAIYIALREHKRAGVPAATMKDGKAVLVPPDEIVVPDEQPNGTASTPRSE